MTNITNMSSWNSNSRTVTLENVSSLLQTSAYDESIDMRTMKSDSCSSFNEAESNDSNRRVIYGTSLPSSTSIMDTIGNLIIGLNKFDDRQETFFNDYNSSSTAYHEIGEMFTPMVSFFPDNEPGTDYPKQAETQSKGLIIFQPHKQCNVSYSF